MNIDHIDRIIDMAAELGAEYLELANTQYYSWAYLNRDQLLPTPRAAAARRGSDQRAGAQRLGDRMRIFFVVPDYYEGTAKKCMNGWGNMFLTVTPDGTALPCHTATHAAGPELPERARARACARSGTTREGFNRYRGTGWMKEPCRAVRRREKDLGGCRCQAFMLANDPAVADPVCSKSPHHAVVLAAVERADSVATRPVIERPLIFRDAASSRRLQEQPLFAAPNGGG